MAVWIACRPLAPSVLAEEADAWFDGVPSCGSPYMSITAVVKPERRAKVPAVVHVDADRVSERVRLRSRRAAGGGV